MTSLHSEERVDLSELASRMGVEIANIADLAEAIRTGRSCLSLMGSGSREEAWGASKSHLSLVSIELLAHLLDEHACYPRLGCVAISEFLLKARLWLPLHSFFSHSIHS